MTIVGCYSLDLYCSRDDCKGGHMKAPYQFTGRSEAHCKAQARAKGWRFVKRDVVCPWCIDSAKEAK